MQDSSDVGLGPATVATVGTGQDRRFNRRGGGGHVGLLMWCPCSPGTGPHGPGGSVLEGYCVHLRNHHPRTFARRRERGEPIFADCVPDGAPPGSAPGARRDRYP
ncbi:hypothetical protein ACFFX0_05930 [Citricoccus parietis]|uniref:Uncharacterized protein n=1 Tax=Citricoccus parietis TaxID=592307 RepID=A0ABV5FVP1_9MICC